jgi:phosphoribosylaminoimidazole carboxylase (NCAIR synthetase)
MLTRLKQETDLAAASDVIVVEMENVSERIRRRIDRLIRIPSANQTKKRKKRLLTYTVLQLIKLISYEWNSQA